MESQYPYYGNWSKSIACRQWLMVPGSCSDAFTDRSPPCGQELSGAHPGECTVTQRSVLQSGFNHLLLVTIWQLWESSLPDPLSEARAIRVLIKASAWKTWTWESGVIGYRKDEADTRHLLCFSWLASNSNTNISLHAEVLWERRLRLSRLNGWLLCEKGKIAILFYT